VGSDRGHGGKWAWRNFTAIRRTTASSWGKAATGQQITRRATNGALTLLYGCALLKFPAARGLKSSWLMKSEEAVCQKRWGVCGVEQTGKIFLVI
jgi:hypothetical protein